MGFAGVLVVAGPGLIGSGSGPGLLAAALCALCFALTAVATKRLTRTEPVGAILFWLNLMQAAAAAAIAGGRGGVPWPDLQQAPWLLAIGASGTAAHWCLTSALRAVPASVAMPLDFLRLPVIAALGWLLYGEALGPSLVLGAGLILAGNLLTLRPQAGQERPAES